MHPHLYMHPAVVWALPEQSDDKDVSTAAKATLDAYYGSQTGRMNFMQAQRTFRATQRSRGFNGPKGGKGFSKGFSKGFGKSKKGKKGKGKGFPRFGKGDEDAMAASSSSSRPEAWDEAWWADEA